MPKERYIRASDIGTHVFCARALHLKDAGAPSSLVREREAGIAFHQRHGERVHRAVQSGRIAMLAAVLGLLLTACAILLWLR